MNVEKIRNDFPLIKQGFIYFDSAASSQKPKIVIDKIKEIYESYYSNVHRGVYRISAKITEEYESAREKIARFINAKSQEVIFTRNATEGLNLVSYILSDHIEEGDEIVITISEHHSNLVPWQQLSIKKGAILKYIDVYNDGRLNLEYLENTITERTKVLAIGHVSNITGIIHPIEKIIKFARNFEHIYIVVDACQSVPHIKVDVKKLDCDFLAFSAHKMLGPTGIGILYAKEELLEKLPPFLYGGDMIDTVELYETKFNRIPYKYEAGTPNFVDAIAFGYAVDYINEIGMENIYNHEKKLLDYFLSKMLYLDFVELYGPKDSKDRICVVPFNVKSLHPHDTASFLDYKNICVRSGHHCAQPLLKRMKVGNSVRASLYLYNTTEEIDIFIDALKEIYKYL
ncbi:MAG: SufS family cysteine desulfurase [candidate division WOR-3 bacterium]|nr:SufS family cysteine desulfurase [candidate division WOR-3 bacterium]MDW8151082.1 SufS family cysteine desulfurase [candidate division WOR-3 bacterium]